MTGNLIEIKVLNRRGRWKVGHDRHITKSPVRPFVVVVMQPSFENIPQMLFTENNKVVETLGFNSGNAAFSVGIQIRSPRRNRPELDTIEFEDRTELFRELCIAVTNDVRGLELGLFVGKDHAHVPSHLRHPRAVGIGRHAGDVDLACV